MTTATKTRRRQPTPEQKAKAAEKRARMQSIITKLAAMSPDERIAIARRLPVTKISGEAYSVANACLLTFQSGGRPLTVLGGFAQWIKAGRSVRKGEHGYSVWVPIGRKTTDEETGETVTAKTGFVLGTVFDVSQTVELKKD